MQNDSFGLLNIYEIVNWKEKEAELSIFKQEGPALMGVRQIKNYSEFLGQTKRDRFWVALTLVLS